MGQHRGDLVNRPSCRSSAGDSPRHAKNTPRGKKEAKSGNVDSDILSLPFLPIPIRKGWERRGKEKGGRDFFCSFPKKKERSRKGAEHGAKTIRKRSQGVGVVWGYGGVMWRKSEKVR